MQLIHRGPSLLLAAALLAPAALAQTATGYFHAEGTEIIDPSGNPAVPRGVGLGGWLVPEGYMLDIATPDGGSPTSIRAQIEDLIGPANTDAFYQLYEANYVDEKDIAAIAALGADHVRLPFHYKLFYDPDTGTFREEGFARLDTFLGWCRTHGLSVILDMHAAPGAQNDGPISDSDGVARLWTEPVPHQDQTVEIWKEIARRYADEPIIMGYDLINEPVTPAPFDNPDLRALYVRIADSIRTVDANHILFIEGNYYATHFPYLDQPFDDNMVYAFHKYWNGPDQGSIQYLLTLRDQTNVPLWLGETGENSNTWYYQVGQLMNQHRIGINWWTHKQIEATVSVWSAPYAPGYQDVIDYWRGAGPRPSDRAASTALFAMAAGLDLDSCEVRVGVAEAQWNLGFGFQRKPFKNLVIPGIVNAADYDIGWQGASHWDSDAMATTGAAGGGNNGGVYRNDGVDIERSTDPQGFEYNVGWMEAGEWIRYTVNIDTAGIYDIDLRVASASGGGRLLLKLDEVDLGSAVTVNNTGGWQNWVTVTIPGVSLPAGKHLLRLLVEASGANLNRMIFRLVSPTAVEEVEPTGSFRLTGLYPNPFARDLTVRLDGDTPSRVSARLFDLLGREVYALPARDIGAGPSPVILRPDVAPGTYLLRIVVDDGRRSRTFHRAVVRAR